MISWIQRTFQQHYRMVFLVLLAIVIVTFVFTIGAMPGGGGPGGSQSRSIELFGRSLTTVEQQREFVQDGNLSLQLNGYQGIRSQADFENYRYYRAAGLYLADKLGVPEPTEAQIATFIRTLPAFTGPEGNYDPQAYQRFRDDFKANSDLPESRVLKVMMEDWRLREITKALEGPGYVNEADLTRAFEEAETLWTVQTAKLDLTDVKGAGEPTEEELQRWFEAQTFRYDTPERMIVDYVEFRAADFVGQVHPTEDEIVTYFNDNKSRYQNPPPPPVEGATTPPPPPAEVTLAEKRDQVVADLARNRAARLAARAASTFAKARFDANVVPGTPQFDAFLNAQGVVLQTTSAFTHDQPPAGTTWTPQVLNQAFALNSETPVSNEIRAGDNTVILFFKEHIPPAPQTLAAVRERVVEDVKQDLRRRAIVGRGEEIRRQLNTALTSGTSFADAAKAAGLEAKSWEKFKRSSPPADLERAVLGMLSDSKLNEVPPMSVQENSGTFVLVSAKDVPTPESLPDAFAKIRENMTAYYAELASRAALDEVVQNAIAAAGLAGDQEAL